jgi:hypothetical protein
MVDVAQLVEPRVVIPVVVGSSPIVHPNFLAATRGVRPQAIQIPSTRTRMPSGRRARAATTPEWRDCSMHILGRKK